MAIRQELVVIAVLLFIILILVLTLPFFEPDVEEADASKFVMEDLRIKYPDAEIAIINIKPLENSLGQRYFEVKAKVTEHANTSCPERSHIFYNYPSQNFVPQPPEIITSNCEVCTEGICTIAFPEEAIIASHTFSGTEAISWYLDTYDDAIPTVTQGEKSWLVGWSSETANLSYYIDIHRNGTVLNVSSN
jgi:hypothetical protein